LKTGAIVGFKDKKGVSYACVFDCATNKLRVLTDRGKEFSFPADKVLFESAAIMPTSPRDRVLDGLRTFRDSIGPVQDKTDLATIWELLAEDGVEFELDELAGEYFGDSCGDQERAALMCLLVDDVTYFKQKGRRFAPRSPEQVAEILKQHEVEALRERERALAIAWLHKVVDRRNLPDQAPPPIPDGALRHIQNIKGYAVHMEGYENARAAVAILREIGPPDPFAAFDILVAAGVFDPDENLLVHRFAVPVEFPADVLESAQSAQDRVAESTGPASDPGRRDLRHLEPVTVDDVDTADIDDALTVEESGSGGCTIGVHIADATHLVEEGGPLDLEAQRRASTIYLPDRRIPMLPRSLSEGLLSLRAGEDRPAMSILADLDADGVVRSFEITPSTLRVRRRLTYYEADDLIGNDPALTRIHGMARKLRDRRIEAGALTFNSPDLKITVGDGGLTSVMKVMTDTPSHLAVSEMMILANRLVAEWCQERGVPAIYRFQPPPEEPIKIREYDPVESYRARRLLKKSESAVKPLSHSGLGIPAYVQFTSPIRRYTDLTMHRQIRGALSGTGSPHSEEELALIISSCDRSQDVIGMIQRQGHRYWLLKHIERVAAAELPAIVLDKRDDTTVVLLTDYMLETAFHPRPETRLEVGQHISVKILSVAPRKGNIRVREGQR